MKRREEKYFKKEVGLDNTMKYQISENQKYLNKLSCPPKKKAKKVDNLTIYSTKNQVYNFLNSKLKITSKNLKKIIVDEIDGEALVILTEGDLKSRYGIKESKQEELSQIIVKDIFKLNDKINENTIYKELYTKTFDVLCESLDSKLYSKELKYGEKLKYIKYLIIQNPPPNKENKDQLKNYLKKILSKNENIDNIEDNIEENDEENLEDNVEENDEENLEDNIEGDEKIEDAIINDIDNLLIIDNKDLIKKCEEKGLEGYDLYKVILIIEFIKKNNKNDIVNNNGNINEQNEENNEAAPYINTQRNNEENSKYLLYCVVEVFVYETSQNEISYGMRNPIDEFKRICKDFEIENNNECEYIDFNGADKIKLSSVMIWGSKEGIYSFLEEKKIKESFDDFMIKNENENKTGIYLCINIIKNIGYLIIWPGKLSYQYSDINETNNSMLLTLIRYGFYLSSNSILCLTEKEMENFDQYGYQILEKDTQSRNRTHQFDYISNRNKDFKIQNERIITEGIDLLSDKKIVKSIIKNNSLLIFEESEKKICEEIVNKKCDEFSEYESQFDLYFDDNFIINDPDLFYLIIKKNPFFIKNNNINECYSEFQIMDIFKEKLDTIINDVFKQMYDGLLNEKNIKCKYCQKSLNDISLELYFETDINKSIIYFHKKCYMENNNFNLILFNENENYKINEKDKLYEKSKEKILSKNDYIISKEEIQEFFRNLEEKNSISEHFLEELEKFKNKLSRDENLKYLIIGEELKQIKDKKDIKDWIETWKKKINQYFKENEKTFKKWIVLKSFNDDAKTLNYEYKEIDNSKIVANLYNIMPIRNSNNLTLSYKEKFEKEINDFFPNKYKGLFIYKNGTKNEIKLNEGKTDIFEGIYDYDNNSKTLIIHKYNAESKKISLYFNMNDGNRNFNFTCRKNLNIDKNIGNSKLNKIMLIPRSQKHEENINENILLFIDNKIRQNTEDEKKIELGDNFEKFQFIVYYDFLLTLKFNTQSNLWNGKIYSLCFEDKSEFDEIKTITIKVDKNAKFSLSEIGDKKYLFAFTIEDNKPKIYYWEIISQISVTLTNRTIGENENEINENTSLGNCIINYFFLCFYKYPIIGAIEYAFKEFEQKKDLKLSFFIQNKNNNLEDNLLNLEDLKNYAGKLKELCEKKKSISFNDINFSIENKQIKFDEKDISIGKLLIKFLEVVPIQIAKILGQEFTIMTNGERIDKILSNLKKKREQEGKDKNIEREEYPKLIHFCMKESIFNYKYFEFPVIVLCCFGAQSMGKSTFLNELTGSLFDVSGMRCTEGIWMAIKLFKHSLKINIRNCNRKCECKKKCYLFGHDSRTKCICENCICGKDCELKGNNDDNENSNCCSLKCSLRKNHEESSKCSINNCNCKCICECICNTNSHKHKCNKCSKENKDECNCSCNCKHFCKYPVLMHNFLCICLDFEGLGTLERTNQQDIQMALIGSAMGNNVILRTSFSYDQFIQDTLGKLSEGSNKIKKNEGDDNIINEDFFGGSLFISPRDVIDRDQKDLENEFYSKIKESVDNWYKDFKKKNINIKYNMFGLFKDYIFSPTPLYYQPSYYEKLRGELTNDIITNSLRYRRHPIYEKGEQFCSNFKLFLSIIFNKDYIFLSRFREEEIKKYLKENISKAYEVLGEYEDAQENEPNNNTTILNNELNLYLNKNYLKYLVKNTKKNEKFETNENTLLIDKISCKENIEGEYNIKEIKFNVKKSEGNIFSFSIENMKDFGLILSVPKILENFDQQQLCSNLFKLWNEICKKVNLSEKDIRINFDKFISALIERRNQNVNKWIKEITNDYDNLKYFQSKISTLSNNWRLCQEKCESCYINCSKLKNNDNIQHKHECGYDHKCKEKCQKCKEINIDEKKNEIQQCTKGLGHSDDDHSCDQFHRCLKECDYYPHSKNCKKDCCLELNHKGEHKCNELTHYCNGQCNLYEIANNCNKECKLPLGPIPNTKLLGHEGKHNCCQEHKCKEVCEYEKDSKPDSCNKICDKICNINYEHEGIHKCGKEPHYCNHDCDYKINSRECGGKCILTWPHDGKHNCCKDHKCKEYCKHKDNSKPDSCGIFCNGGINEHEDHNCGKDHLCNSDCHFKDKSRDCKKICVLNWPHDNQLHNCGKNKVHRCNAVCDLKEKSKPETCSKFCNKILNGDYKHDGPHICDKKKENEDEHKCKGKCKNCNSDCTLTPEHKNDCTCGKCLCNKPCKYNYLRNCQGTCREIFGHSENKEHNCNNQHYCNKDCKYHSSCQKKCNYKQKEIHQEHICELLKKENHKCNKSCDLSNLSNCEGHCYLTVGHEHEQPIHKCDAELHKCKEDCYLKGDSQVCNNERKCKWEVRRNEPEEKFRQFKEHTEHICSINKHKCNKTCKYFIQHNRECPNKCDITARHPTNEKCKCSSGSHVCMEKCIYSTYNNFTGCNEGKYCNLGLPDPGRDHMHNCKGNHKCIANCDLKEARKCGKNCIKTELHNNNHKCAVDPSEHKCQKKCSLKEIARGCIDEGNCKYTYPHNSNSHLCPAEHHYCNQKCDYPDCNQKCKYIYDQHPNNNIHKCENWDRNPYYHICKEKCYLFRDFEDRKCTGCGEHCKLEYKHNDNLHKCYRDDNNPHKCNKKCDLCDSPCVHVYKHENEYNLVCLFCKDYGFENCKLKDWGPKCQNHPDIQKKHLCHQTHKCKTCKECRTKCKKKGYCDILPTFLNEYMSIFRQSSFSTEEKENLKKLIKQSKKLEKCDCTIEIPINKFEHDGEHKCDKSKHYCGFKCDQCENYCNDEYDKNSPNGHSTSHKMEHGNIINSKFRIIDSSDSIKISIDYVNYKVKNEERAIIFTCTDYCNNQGRGHTHLVPKFLIANFNDKRILIYEKDKNYYECRCSYFWEKILKMDNGFPQDKKELFDKCDCYCPCELHDPQKNKLNYCQREIMHGKYIPNELKTKEWFSPEGHVFDCNHPSGIYTIFLIDRSGSMDSESIKPEMESISQSKKHNNMLGASIEALLKFCEKRFTINRREKCALIGYDNDAQLIFKDYYVEQEDKIKNECLLKLYPSGGTEFKEAFKEAKKLLDEINNNKQYRPIIILLTDGEDFHPNETIEYVKNMMESEKLVKVNEEDRCKIYCIFFQPNYSSEEAKNTLNKIAEYGGTKEYITSKTLDELSDAFSKISGTIEKTFIIKYH